jgi:hypothetical protein
MFVVANPFGANRSWRTSWLIALAFEGFVAIIFATVGVGADNPLPFYLAFALQLPASLLIEPLLGLAKALGLAEDNSLVFAYAVVASIEVAIVAVLLRAPWRKKLVPPHIV